MATNGKVDEVISSARALDLQEAARSEESQLIWRVEIPRLGEHAGKYIARPIAVRCGRPLPMACVLVGASLADIHDALPRGLRIVPCEDALIVENWIEA